MDIAALNFALEHNLDYFFSPTNNKFYRVNRGRSITADAVDQSTEVIKTMWQQLTGLRAEQEQLRRIRRDVPGTTGTILGASGVAVDEARVETVYGNQAMPAPIDSWEETNTAQSSSR